MDRNEPASSGPEARVARGTLWNLAGLASPILFAVASVPALIRNLGTARFGFITIAWTLMAYFGLFDLGLARATTWAVARLPQGSETGALPRLVWSSLLAHLGLGLVGGGALALMSPWLAEDLLRIPPPMRAEARDALELLAVSVPAVVATAALRGVLEARSRFDLANILRLAASAGAYLLPMAISFATPDLRAVVGGVVLSRVVVLALHLRLCGSLLSLSWGRVSFDARLIVPLLPFGGWVAASSLMTPLVISLDRAAIGARVSLEAVAYYATPYEVVTKLHILSGSLLLAAFPALSALAVSLTAEVRELYHRMVNIIAVAAVPSVGLVLLSSRELLAFWVGGEFAHHGAPVARWLAVGVLANLLGSVPLTLLQAAGRAGVVARLQLVQLPWYAWAVWHVAGRHGITAVAVIWSLRASVETLLLFRATERLAPLPHAARPTYGQACACGAFLLACWAVGSSSLLRTAAGCALAASIVAAFLAWEWSRLLQESTRKSVSAWILSRLRRASSLTE